MFVYEVGPIDNAWEYCPTVTEFAKNIVDLELIDNFFGFRYYFEGFSNDFLKAKKLASEIGWEGDFREEARVFLIPTHDCFEYGFVWKQDNNGTTFVVSPVELPHLK